MSNERGPAYLESVYLFGTPGRDHRLAPGPRRRRRRVLLPAHDDARSRPSSSTGSTRSSPTSPSRRRRGPSAARRRRGRGGAPPRRWGDRRRDPARRAAGQAAPPAALAGHARRRVRRGGHRRPLRPAGAGARRRRGRRRGGARSRLARARRHGALQAGGGRAVRRGRGRRARRSARSTTSPATADGRLVGFNTDAPGFRAGRRARAGPAARRRSRSSWPAPAARRTRSCTPASSSGAARVTVGNRTAAHGRGDARAVLDGRRPAPGRGGPRRSGVSGSDHERPTSRSTRRRSGCSSRGSTIPVERLPAHATVFDLVYVPAETPLLRGGAGTRAAGGQRLGDADRAGGHRVRALDRRRRDGGRDARGRRAAPRRPHRDRLSMRYATIAEPSGLRVAVVVGETAFPLDPGLTMAEVVAGEGRPGPPSACGRARRWRTSRSVRQSRSRGRSTPSGSTTTARAPRRDPERPLSTARRASAVGGTGRDASPGIARSPTTSTPRCELGVVIGRPARDSRPDAALDHVLGYTIVNDVSSRDEWLDGDQWLLGKSMPGFCPGRTLDRHRRRARPDRPPARLHDQRRADPGRPAPRTCGSRSPRSSRTSAATSRSAPAT